MKINLNSGESLTAVLSGAHTTTAPTAKVDYLDSGTPRTTMAALTGATAVTLLSGPTNGVRPVDGVSIYNGDTAQITVTIKQVIDGTQGQRRHRGSDQRSRLDCDQPLLVQVRRHKHLDRHRLYQAGGCPIRSGS
jgi:hypothetical protein